MSEQQITAIVSETVLAELPMIVTGLVDVAGKLPACRNVSWVMAFGMFTGCNAEADQDDALVLLFRSAIRQGRAQMRETPDDEL